MQSEYSRERWCVSNKGKGKGSAGAGAMLEMHRVHFLLVHCKSVASMLWKRSVKQKKAKERLATRSRASVWKSWSFGAHFLLPTRALRVVSWSYVRARVFYLLPCVVMCLLVCTCEWSARPNAASELRKEWCVPRVVLGCVVTPAATHWGWVLPAVATPANTSSASQEKGCSGDNDEGRMRPAAYHVRRKALNKSKRIIDSVVVYHRRAPSRSSAKRRRRRECTVVGGVCLLQHAYATPSFKGHHYISNCWKTSVCCRREEHE